MKKTKKKQKTVFKFRCPIFGVRVCLSLGEEKPIKIFGAEYTPLKDSCAESTVIKSDDMEVGYHVWIKDKTDYDSMIHETVHLIRRIFDKKGIPFNSDNDEMMAYYQNYWIRKFWDKMSKFIKEGD